MDAPNKTFVATTLSLLDLIGCNPRFVASIVVALSSVFAETCFAEAEEQGKVRSIEVGYVSLVLGKAYLISNDKRIVLSKGATVTAGDLVYTESNGHVHLRFIDEGLVSVRPRSTLEIERYDFDSRNPKKSAVKFNLREGVARSISGNAAKSARGRFRLNTPVAAIGVRGTDFVVSANSSTTKALVYEGSIVMAPFSALCSFDGLGPCSQNAVELADDTLQIIELNRSNLLPQIGTAQTPSRMSDLQDRQLAGRAPAQSGGAARESGQIDGSSAYLEVAASDKVIHAGVSRGGVSDLVEVVDLPDYTPEIALEKKEVTASQLVWGRFGTANGSNERLSVDRLVAAEERNVTIAAGDYLLYRTETAGARVDRNLGVVGFNLDSAQAFYNTTTGAATMRVGAGRLDIDFVNNSFFTSLELNHLETGTIDFSGGGRIADGGYLIGSESQQTVLGAVSTDAAEAGYYFNKEIEAGTVSGLTLWGGR
jgi:hypothetical protein